MENRIIEYGDSFRRKQPEFLQKLREAENRGFKPTPGIVTEKMIADFMRTGRQIPECTTRKNRLELTSEDRARISKAGRDNWELEQYRKSQIPVRDARRKQIENELKMNRLGMTIIPEKKVTNLFI